jgi:ornithine cyclodeaminase/alanine dehydrogenase-like protein (mu-crystallin family)
MTLILSNDDVAKLLTMRDCINVFEDTYAELSNGRSVNRVRSDCLVPSGQDDALYSLKSMDGVAPNLGVGAVRIDSDIVTWPKQGNNLRRVKVPAAPGGRYVGLVLLFSTQTGEPLAIMPDGVMQRIRVGATNGLGVKYLARKNASSVGILGSGWQAGAQLMAVCAVREVRSIRCFSPNRERCATFAREMSGLLDIEVVPVAQPEDAIGGSDIAMCATNSIDNVFFEHWIEPGMHISSIKITEIELAAIRRADRLVLHSHDDKPIHVTTAGLTVAEKDDDKGWALGRGIDFAGTRTLAEVIAGQTPVRRDEREVTCFINNLGLGLQFAAAGAVVYRKAKEAGLGHELPTDWFTQDVHP